METIASGASPALRHGGGAQFGKVIDMKKVMLSTGMLLLAAVANATPIVGADLLVSAAAPLVCTVPPDFEEASLPNNTDCCYFGSIWGIPCADCCENEATSCFDLCNSNAQSCQNGCYTLPEPFQGPCETSCENQASECVEGCDFGISNCESLCNDCVVENPI